MRATKARLPHICFKCTKIMEKGDTYYSEKLRDIFLHSLHEKKFCAECYEKYGDRLLMMRLPKDRKIKSLDEFF